MRVLLDTHVYLWVVADSSKLKGSARKLIEDADEVFVSAASIWEMAIKIRLGKFDGDSVELVKGIAASGFTELPVSAAHACRVETLPDHHADPFDRLLVAQAVTEPLVLLTADEKLERYGGIVRRV